jgi:hypothetical protein
MVPRAPNAEWAPEFLGVSAARAPLGLALTTKDNSLFEFALVHATR